MDSYYIAVEEWLYPTESGRNIVDDFDTKDEAVAYAKRAAGEEMDNFSAATGDDPLPPDEIADEGQSGAIVTAKNGLDDWYYAIRVFRIDPIGTTAPQACMKD